MTNDRTDHVERRVHGELEMYVETLKLKEGEGKGDQRGRLGS